MLYPPQRARDRSDNFFNALCLPFGFPHIAASTVGRNGTAIANIKLPVPTFRTAFVPWQKRKIGSCSDIFDVTYGTARGSCLGPLLFIFFVNDIHLLPLYSKLVLFADDTTIFNSNRLLKFLKFTIEHDLEMMVDWFKENKLSLNLRKTVIMRFWSSDKNFDIRVEGNIIPQVTHTKFLGVHMDNELKWNVHLNQLIDKVRSNKRLLSLGINLLDKNCLKNVYYSHVHSHLIYAISAWGSMASPSQVKELELCRISAFNR